VAQTAARARELERRGEYADALTAAKRCLALEPERQDCLAVARWSMARTGDFAHAFPLLSDCLARQPEDVHCLNGMVSTRLWRGELDRARAAAATLARVDPDGEWTHVALGRVHEAAGEQDAALGEFQQACTQGHDYACRRAAALSGSERIR